MIADDNPLAAAAIAGEPGDDFLAQATPRRHAALDQLRANGRQDFRHVRTDLGISFFAGFTIGPLVAFSRREGNQVGGST
jgi:hypothetical protein